MAAFGVFLVAAGVVVGFCLFFIFIFCLFVYLASRRTCLVHPKCHLVKDTFLFLLPTIIAFPGPDLAYRFQKGFSEKLPMPSAGEAGAVTSPEGRGTETVHTEVYRRR